MSSPIPEDHNYENLKEATFDEYSGLSRINSPALNEDVHFGPEGFNHLISADGHKEREKASQILRFKLLPLAIKLVKTATTFQEYEEQTKGVRVKRRKDWYIRNTPVRYWGLIAIVDGWKFKVIIKKVGDNGPLQFWSIVPNWITSWHRDIKLISTMEGNPETD